MAGRILYILLPIVQSDTKLGAPVKGFCRCYEGTKPADFVILEGKLSLVSLPASHEPLKGAELFLANEISSMKEIQCEGDSLCLPLKIEGAHGKECGWSLEAESDPPTDNQLGHGDLNPTTMRN